MRPTFADLLESHGISSFYGLLYERLFGPMRDSATNVAEIGCGSGAFTSVMRMYFTAADVTGIDIDIGQVKDQWQRDDIIYLNVDARLEGLGYLSGKLRNYDVVIEDTNATTEEHVLMMDNMSPYIKPGGYYIIDASGCQDNITMYIIVATKYGLQTVGYDYNIAIFQKAA